MRYLLLFFIIVSAFAENGVDEARFNLLKEKREKRVILRREVFKPKKDDLEILRRMEENNQKLSELLKKRSSEPLIWDGAKRVLTGRTFRGILLNSIVSTNLESPLLVRPYPNQGLPYGAKFSCRGTTKHKRVMAICDKLVTKTHELSINVKLLNRDGSAGLLGIYNDGKEDLVAGVILSDVAQGALSVAQSRVNTPLGQVAENSLKNQILGGVINGGKTTSEILLDEMKTKEPVVVINAGKEVLIYFMEAADVY